MKYIKLFEQYFNKHQLEIPFEEYNLFSYNIQDIIDYLEGLNIEILDIKKIFTKIDNTSFQFEIDSVYPNTEVNTGLKLKLKYLDDDISHYENIKNYFFYSYPEINIIKESEFSKTLTIILFDTNEKILTYKDWLSLYKNWDYDIKGNVIIKATGSEMIHFFKFSDKILKNYIETSNIEDSFFEYELLDFKDNIVDDLDKDNIKKLLIKFMEDPENIGNLSIDDMKDELKSMSYSIKNEDIITEIRQIYSAYVYNKSDSEACEKINSEFDSELEKNYGINLIKREYDNKSDTLYYYYIFKKEWVDELKDIDHRINNYGDLHDIVYEWFCEYNTKDNFITPDIQFSYIYGEEVKQFNDEIRGLI